jgi:multisubunit Na+/H+ antiporter MnhG subunit
MDLLACWLKTFYERAHLPPMGTTLGTGLILIRYMLQFTALDGRPVVSPLRVAIWPCAETVL